jgi:hypothetical protein
MVSGTYVRDHGGATPLCGIHLGLLIVYIDLTARVGNQPRIFARWPSDLGNAGKMGELKNILERAGRALGAFDRAQEGIGKDARLSETAKASDRREAAKQSLGTITHLQKLLKAEQEELGERQIALLSVPAYQNGDYATVAIDLELAKKIRELGPAAAAQIATTGSDRMVQALMRLPSELTGVSASDKQMVVHLAAKRTNPHEARSLDAFAEGIDATQAGLTNAFCMLVRDAQVSPTDQRSIAGEYMEVLTGVRAPAHQGDRQGEAAVTNDAVPSPEPASEED